MGQMFEKDLVGNLAGHADYLPPGQIEQGLVQAFDVGDTAGGEIKALKAGQEVPCDPARQ